MEIAFSAEPYGKYALSGYRKWLFSLAQLLPVSSLAFKLSLVLRKLTLQNKVKIIDQEILGLKARFYPLDNLFDRHILFQTKYSDLDEFSLISEYLSEDSIFIDIGANTGFYSLLAARVIKKKNHIQAFEPNPVMCQRFKQNIMFNKIGEVIKVHQIGVADKKTTFTLNINIKNLGSSSIVHDYHEGGIKIDCYPLLDILNENNIQRIDMLKIDIEGADGLAMKPFFKEAPKSLYPKRLLIETDEDIDFKELGYRLIKKTKSGNSIYAHDHN